MQSLRLAVEAGAPINVLAIGAHSDDIELGAGGTILRLLRDHPTARITWVVLSAAGLRRAEAESSAAAFLGPAAASVVIHTFRDGHFPYQGGEIKEAFEALKPVQPDVILTHRLEDLHQDHRLVAELTWQTFRDHLVLEYEIVKFEGDLGSPNLFVPLEREDVERKIELLVSGFPSQHGRSWFDPEAFRSILRLRGIESNAPSGFAEAFTCRKVVI